MPGLPACSGWAQGGAGIGSWGGNRSGVRKLFGQVRGSLRLRSPSSCLAQPRSVFCLHPHCTVGSQPAEQHSGAPPGGKPCLCAPRPLPFSAAATGDTGLCRDHAHATLLQYCCYEDVFQNGRCYSVVHPLQYLGHNLSLWCCVHTGEAALQGSPPSSRRQSLGVCAPRVRGPLYSYFEGFFKIFLLIFMKSEEVFFRKSTAISDSHY